LFTNLKIHLDENDFEKTKIYIYNDTYYTGKFNINDTTFQLNVSLIAGGLDFKYKYDVEYQLLSDFDKNDKLYNTYLR
ncbi:hypothetical protein, partial [Escherichia coli]|uniref:hypothetical protein n=1 Tax=Escherichia coli TaxID=562 RepID=UPI003CE577BC